MKYISYCRKSTESEDRQMLSIESQINEMKHKAENDGVVLDKVFTESMSAKSPGRPIFQEMMDYIEKHGKCTLYVWKLDRLARNAFDGGQLSWFMDRNLIVEIHTYEKVYRNIADDKFFMSLDFGIAKKYVDDLSLNVKRGMRTKVEKGGWASKAPFGYVNDRIKKTVEPDKKYIPYLIELFNLYASGGYSLKELVEMMYDKGLRSRFGNKVYKSTIHKVLTNPFYCGLIKLNGKYHAGTHKAVISREIFDQVQDIMNSKNKSRKKTHNFTYRGYMTCNNCGCALTAIKKKGHTYYYCTNGKGICDEHKKYLRSELVDKLMAKVLKKIEFRQEDIEFMYRASKEKLGQDKNQSEVVLQNLQKQLKLTRERQNRLLDSYLAGFITEAVHNEKMQKLNQEITATEMQIKNFDKKKVNDESTLELCKNTFLTAIKAKKEFERSKDCKKRSVLEKVLLNLFIQGRDLAKFKLKEPYQMMSRTPKNSRFGELWAIGDSNPCLPAGRSDLVIF